MSFNVPGDLQLSEDGRNILFVEGEQQLKQACENALRIFRGEWIYDPAAGVPYLQTVFVKGTPLPVIREAFRDQIIRIPGVVDVPKTTLNFDKQSGRLSVEMDILGERGVSLTVSTQLGQ